MKKLVAVLFLAVFMLAGCGVSNLPEPNQKVIVIVERSTGFFEGTNPGIKIACDSAKLDYSARKVIIEGAKQFGSFGGLNWIGNISIEDGKLILELPQDAIYSVLISKQWHELPKIVEGNEK